MKDAAKAAHDIVAQILVSSLSKNYTDGIATLLNVNIPNSSYADLYRWRVIRLGNRHHSQPVVVQYSPRGDKIYWIGAAGHVKDNSEGTDFHAIDEGCISITPMQLDLSH